MKPQPKGDPYVYDGRILCEGCGEATKDEIAEASGKMRLLWDGLTTDQSAWPQRTMVPDGTPCAECGGDA